jgi:fumarate hydratase subunit alpha
LSALRRTACHLEGVHNKYIMKQITTQKITDTVARLCQQVNYFLPEDVVLSVTQSMRKETSETGRAIITQILENAQVAGQKKVALCQDTGITEIFVTLGQGVEITGGSLTEAINKGVAEGYEKGYLRKSIVEDPFERTNTGTNTPAQIYVDVVPGSTLSITLLPKGGGSENASMLKMFSPNASWQDIKLFILEVVTTKGINACPPLVVGVGIGGSFSSVALLAKKALLREMGSTHVTPEYQAREKELLAAINATGIGPMGLGGATTALSAHIVAAPCHIASLPVAVSIQCHSCRRKTEVL